MISPYLLMLLLYYLIKQLASSLPHTLVSQSKFQYNYWYTQSAYI